MNVGNVFALGLFTMLPAPNPFGRAVDESREPDTANDVALGADELEGMLSVSVRSRPPCPPELGFCEGTTMGWVPLSAGIPASPNPRGISLSSHVGYRERKEPLPTPDRTSTFLSRPSSEWYTKKKRRLVTY
jgi:hypothetical protein